ncbi:MULTISPECIES: hypothetical protein [unclassified Mesorhizobium]|uniref:hypothetical protein n=1 Tax=unclassified Mesorhizobium TaxID=325217 RepID=UPI000FD72F02|nr:MULTISPECIES: hypothetical protein [unclassified Mesorhizobium]TGT64083.1 hypothetical protein EN809_035085 [Mesorhizobium sp. M2E.F.Ca.ET.166.01.1.1]TGV97034.1 hypothetical protein EN797_035080 [Mesorhizobium sp. M2E.F.Ca.ET.154.01.1.1]
MATYSHQNVTLRGFHWEVSSLTFNLATGITENDIGKAVSVDASGPNKVKLSGDGDTIIGRLASVENRSVEGSLVGAVELQFANTLPIKNGSVVAVGDTVVGAGAGEVKSAGAANHNANFVAEVIGSMAVVVKV